MTKTDALYGVIKSSADCREVRACDLQRRKQVELRKKFSDSAQAVTYTRDAALLPLHRRHIEQDESRKCYKVHSCWYSIQTNTWSCSCAIRANAPSMLSYCYKLCF